MILDDMRPMTSFGVILLRKRFHLSWISKQLTRRIRWATLLFHKFHNAVQDLADGYGWAFSTWRELVEVPCQIETVINLNSTSVETDLVARRGRVAWFAWVPHRMQLYNAGMTKSWIFLTAGCSTCISMIKEKGIAVAPPQKTQCH